jgi:hypothetical protein
MAYGPGDLDILSRAYETAMSSVPEHERDLEATKTALMAGLLDAAKRGERNEHKLVASALASIHAEATMDAVMQTAPL